MSDKLSIFISGGSGLLALNWALARRAKDIVTLGLHERKIALKDVSDCYCDLDSVVSIQKTFDRVKPDFVVHAAGLTSVELCEANPELAYHANVLLAENVAKACSFSNIPLVHISTDHLFNGELPMLDEEYPISPVNEYAKTKAEAEQRVLEAYPTAIIVRTNFFGWGPSYRASFSDLIIDSLRSGRVLNLFGDVFYTPILMETLVSLIHQLVKRKANGIYNVVGNQRMSKYQFGMNVANHFSLDSRLINKCSLLDRDELIRRPMDMSISNEKLKIFLGSDVINLNQQLEILQQQSLNGITKEIQAL